MGEIYSYGEITKHTIVETILCTDINNNSSAVHSYRVPGMFIRRLKSLFVYIVVRKVYSSSTNKAKMYSHSIFVQ
jgi:hypothetical protein